MENHDEKTEEENLKNLHDSELIDCPLTWTSTTEGGTFTVQGWLSCASPVDFPWDSYSAADDACIGCTRNVFRSIRQPTHIRQRDWDLLARSVSLLRGRRLTSDFPSSTEQTRHFAFRTEWLGLYRGRGRSALWSTWDFGWRTMPSSNFSFSFSGAAAPAATDRGVGLGVPACDAFAAMGKVVPPRGAGNHHGGI